MEPKTIPCFRRPITLVNAFSQLLIKTCNGSKRKLFSCLEESWFSDDLRGVFFALRGPLSQVIMHGDSVAFPLHNWKISWASDKALGADEGCPNTDENGKVFLNI